MDFPTLGQFQSIHLLLVRVFMLSYANHVLVDTLYFHMRVITNGLLVAGSTNVHHLYFMNKTK